MNLSTKKKTIMKKNPSFVSLKQRIVALFTAAIMLLQICLPTIAWAASALSNESITASMSSPRFQKSSSNAYLYEQATFDDASYIGSQNITTFREKLVAAKMNLGKPTFVPIASDITIFIPTYPTGKLIGDAYVQNRYIRQQVFDLLGRHLIYANSTNTSEVAQINALYEAAFVFAKANPTINFGANLDAATIARISLDSGIDMIWPELRVINGESVVVPVLYLKTSTINDNKVTKTKTEFMGSVANLGSITLNHTELTLGAKTVVTTAGNLTATNNALINSGGDINLVVGGTLNLIGSSITGKKSVTIFANEANIKSVLVPFQDRYGQGTKLGRISGIDAGENISLTTTGNVTFEGSTATASNGSLTIKAGGNISILPLFATYQGQSTVGHWAVNSSSVDVIGSRLSAQDLLSLGAEGVINITASDLISTLGGIELLAGQGIHILDELDQTQIQKVDRKGKTTGQSSEFRTEAVRAILKAGKGVLLNSEFGDVVLKATNITSTEGTKVEAKNGTVHLLMTKELEEFHLNTVEKSTWTIKTKTIDVIHENNIQNAIVGGLQVQAKYGVNVEYTGKVGASFEQQIEDFRNMPGMEWVAQLYDQNVATNWAKMDEIHKELRKTKRNLSPAAMAIVAICVAVATGGAGAGWAGAIQTSVAGTASVIGTAAASSLGAALYAGAVAVTTQAAQSLAAGNSVGSTLSALDSSESIKSLAISMATAGAMQHTDIGLFTKAADSKNLAVSLSGQAAQAVVNSSVSAGISVVITGGNSDDYLSTFKQGLMTSAVNKIGENMANKIGAAYRDGDINNAVRYIAHAASGCAIAIAQGSVNRNGHPAEDNCSVGAAGAVSGELSADAYKARNQTKIDAATSFLNNQAEYYKSLKGLGYSPEEAAKIMSNQTHHYMVELNKLHAAGVDVARLVGGLSAAAIGGDVNLGAQTGANAAANNALFLIPLAIIALKAADLFFTGEEIWKVIKAYEGGAEKGDEALKQYLIEQGQGALISKIVPGAKTLEGVFGILKDNGVISPKIIDGVESYLKDKKTNESNQQSWTGERAPINTHNAGHGTPDYKKWIGDCEGCAPKGTVFSNPDGTVTYVRNDGVSVTYVDRFPVFDNFMTHPSGVTEIKLDRPFAPGTQRYKDYKAANEAVGHPEWGSKPPEGWTWHHHENGTTMMLIPRDIHDSFNHHGGVTLNNE